jgi:uncharacterized membrane protein
VFQAWLLQAANLLLPTIAVLLLLASQQRLSRILAELGQGEVRHAFERHNRRASIAMGFLAAWLVIQYLPLVYP